MQFSSEKETARLCLNVSANEATHEKILRIRATSVHRKPSWMKQTRIFALEKPCFMANESVCERKGTANNRLVATDKSLPNVNRCKRWGKLKFLYECVALRAEWSVMKSIEGIEFFLPSAKAGQLIKQNCMKQLGRKFYRFWRTIKWKAMNSLICRWGKQFFWVLKTTKLATS